jgi:hypothetical protein
MAATKIMAPGGRGQTANKGSMTQEVREFSCFPSFGFMSMILILFYTIN